MLYPKQLSFLFTGFAITGAVMLNALPVQGQEIDVASANSIAIPDGTASVSNYTGTQFGSANVNGGVVSHTFRLSNLDPNSTLQLTSAVFSGANAGDFSLSSPLPPSIVTQANGLTLFIGIDFNRSGAGQRDAVLTITSNDANEGSYNFALRGTGLNGNPPAASDLQVLFNLAPKAKFNAKKNTTKLSWKVNVVNLGSVAVSGASVTNFYSPDLNLNGLDPLIATLSTTKPFPIYDPQKPKIQKLKFKTILEGSKPGLVFVQVEPNQNDMNWQNNTAASSFVLVD